jgi:hypothetical protein
VGAIAARHVGRLSRDLVYECRHGWIAGGGYQITGGSSGAPQDAGKTWRFHQQPDVS